MQKRAVTTGIGRAVLDEDLAVDYFVVLSYKTVLRPPPGWPSMAVTEVEAGDLPCPKDQKQVSDALVVPTHKRREEVLSAALLLTLMILMR
jgi:hypothetical protein